MSLIFNKHFTVASGIAVQNEQLARWEKKLVPALYADLVNKCNEENEKLTHCPDATGYNVYRGGDMDGFIFNWEARP
jgi:hypothetical protein